MAGDTIIFRRGSTFEFQGQFKDSAGVPISLVGVTPGIYETQGSGMQDVSVNTSDAALGKFLAYLPTDEAKKLPLGRNSWFKIKFDYDASATVVVFPPIWLDVR
jgi:hypothetical protein